MARISENSLTAVLDGITQPGVKVQAKEKEAHGKCDFACAVYNRTNGVFTAKDFPVIDHLAAARGRLLISCARKVGASI